MLQKAIISLVVSFVVTAIAGRFLIPVLKSIKMGQKILDIGPRWHKSKEGTPTMGGIFFILGTLVALLCCGIYAGIQNGNTKELLINYIFVFLCGVIGFIDDRTKFMKKQNKGLSPSEKLILQFLSAAAYVFATHVGKPQNTTVTLPFTGYELELSVFYYLFLIVGIVFTVNSVNLTDGIDGLAATVTAIVSVFLGVMCYKTENELALIFAATVLGGCLGFLVYNFYPARVFMGDTGSLFLGGAVSALAVWLDMPLLLIFVGIIYYAEALSVVIQVISYKLFKKRVFKMSPIHHHFEMCSWSELKIVAVFSFVTIVLSAIGCYGYLIV